MPFVVKRTQVPPYLASERRSVWVDEQLDAVKIRILSRAKNAAKKFGGEIVRLSDACDGLTIAGIPCEARQPPRPSLALLEMVYQPPAAGSSSSAAAPPPVEGGTVLGMREVFGVDSLDDVPPPATVDPVDAKLEAQDRALSELEERQRQRAERQADLDRRYRELYGKGAAGTNPNGQG